MTWRRFWLLLFLLVSGLEIWTLFNRDRKDTFSDAIWTGCDTTPLVPFGIGIVMGHWFWPRK